MSADPLGSEGGWVEGPGGEEPLRALPPGLAETVPDPKAQDDDQHREAAAVEAEEARAGRVAAGEEEPPPAEPVALDQTGGKAREGYVLVELKTEVAKTATSGLEMAAKIHRAAEQKEPQQKIAALSATRAERCEEAAVQLRGVLLRDDLSG